MNADMSLNLATALLFGAFLITIASTVIPVYGYYRKRWKGAALGCLLQPVACFIVFMLFAGGIVVEGYSHRF